MKSLLVLISFCLVSACAFTGFEIIAQDEPKSEAEWHQYVKDNIEVIEKEHGVMSSKIDAFINKYDDKLNSMNDTISTVRANQLVVISRLSTIERVMWLVAAAMIGMIINEFRRHIFGGKSDTSVDKHSRH
jgi:hypothetical protein